VHVLRSGSGTRSGSRGSTTASAASSCTRTTGHLCARDAGSSFRLVYPGQCVQSAVAVRERAGEGRGARRLRRTSSSAREACRGVRLLAAVAVFFPAVSGRQNGPLSHCRARSSSSPCVSLACILHRSLVCPPSSPFFARHARIYRATPTSMTCDSRRHSRLVIHYPLSAVHCSPHPGARGAATHACPMAWKRRSWLHERPQSGPCRNHRRPPARLSPALYFSKPRPLTPRCCSFSLTYSPSLLHGLNLDIRARNG
jgi:hypothetical protein